MKTGDRGRRRWQWSAALPPLAVLLVAACGRHREESASPVRHVVEIRAMAFHPPVLEVARGDTVVWINQDIVPHTASTAGTPEWDTGTLTRGQQSRFVPRQRGEAPYICMLHPTMQGKLIIR